MMITWEQKAKDVARFAHNKILQFQPIYDWLENQGINEQLINWHDIGYLDDPISGSFEEWGIERSQLSHDELARGMVRVPTGIVCPVFVEFHLVALCVIRPGQDTPYGTVLGSKRGPWDSQDILLDMMRVPRSRGEIDLSHTKFSTDSHWLKHAKEELIARSRTGDLKSYWQ